MRESVVSADFSTEAVVEDVRRTVETILERPIDEDRALGIGFYWWAKELNGNHSTQPERVHPSITSNKLRGPCWFYSTHLGRELEKEGVMVSTAHSSEGRKETGRPFHHYLVVVKNGIEVTVDPTIGQFVLGHNHVFVGTTDQLWDMIEDIPSSGSPYVLPPPSTSDSPRDAFTQIWGYDPVTSPIGE